MSLDNVLKFGRLVMDDEALQAELREAVGTRTGAEAAQAAAKVAITHGYDCTPEEVEEGYKVLVASRVPANDELSDFELDAVAGGKGQGSAGGSKPRNNTQQGGTTS